LGYWQEKVVVVHGRLGVNIERIPREVGTIGDMAERLDQTPEMKMKMKVMLKVLLFFECLRGATQPHHTQKGERGQK
jgi:hypothetical protein